MSLATGGGSLTDGPNQMMVSVRTRPLSSTETARGERKVVRAFCQDKVVCISKEARQGAVLKSEMGAQHDYQFDRVFGPDTTQEEIYKATTQEIVFETLKGKNCTVFAYGSTGAGKTFTMLGTDSDPGIIPRSLVDIFQGIEKIEANPPKSDLAEVTTREWTVKLSYLEVYNETIYDLLTEKQRPLQPCEDPNDARVKVLGLTEIVVTSVDQVLELLNQGNTRRRMESTAANLVSSRSHAVIQVNVECLEVEVKPPIEAGRRRVGDKPKKQITSSKLSLIDLAGSERAASTQNRGARLREGANINKSLLALANCINALSSKKGSRVKYRDSKLTHLLKSSLEGNCRLSMIAAINPSHKCYEESHNTLKYANRAKDIKVKASPSSNRARQVDTEDSDLLDDLVAENQALRERLSAATVRMSTDSTETKQGALPRSIPENACLETIQSDEDTVDTRPRTRSRTKSRRESLNPSSSSSDMTGQRDMTSVNQHLEERIGILEVQHQALSKIVAERAHVGQDELVKIVEVATVRAMNERDDRIQELEQSLLQARQQVQQVEARNRRLLNAQTAAEFMTSEPTVTPTKPPQLRSRRQSSCSKENSKWASNRKKKARRESFIPKPPPKPTRRKSTEVVDASVLRPVQKVERSNRPEENDVTMASPMRPSRTFDFSKLKSRLRSARKARMHNK